MAYTKYSLTPANNNAAPPDGAPEGMLPSAVNDTMRDMMAQIRDCGDGIRGGTYTMTAPVITGGSISGTTFASGAATITGGSINNTPIGASTASTGKFSTLTNAALTSGRVTYAGTSGVLQDDADFTFNGTTVTMANDASISGLTVGKGGGAVASNTAVGLSALNGNSTGANNTAIGETALYSNTTASNNTAVGYHAGYSNTTGTQNALFGNVAGYANTTGTNNTAMGHQALDANTTGDNNTAVGVNALGAQTTASSNTAIGVGAGGTITTGTKNTILGCYDGNQGGLDIRTSSNYIVLSDGDGNPRAYWDSNGVQFTTASITDGYAIQVRNTTGTRPYCANFIFSSTAPNNTTETFLDCEDTVNQKAKIYSSGAFASRPNSYGGLSDVKLKQDIVDAASQWDDIKAVRVRKFRFKDEPDSVLQLGVVAQEIEQTSAGLVYESLDFENDENGNKVATGEVTKSVKYSILYMKAIKALQEAMERIETLEAKITALENK